MPLSKSVKYRNRLITECDTLVSLVVRNRDKQCQTFLFLGKYPEGSTREISELQCGHLFSRRFGATRFDLVNCNAQCPGCKKYHNYNSVPYTDWFITKYGLEKWRELYLETRTIKKWTV